MEVKCGVKGMGYNAKGWVTGQESEGKDSIQKPKGGITEKKMWSLALEFHCPAKFRSNLDQTHQNQLVKVFRITKITRRCV